MEEGVTAMKSTWRYEGWRKDERYIVLRDGRDFDPVPSSLKWRWADDFAFGSRSLEAQQLAFALLIEERLGVGVALSMAERFRDEVIVALPTDGRHWTLTSDDVWRWIMS